MANQWINIALLYCQSIEMVTCLDPFVQMFVILFQMILKFQSFLLHLKWLNRTNLFLILAPNTLAVYCTKIRNWFVLFSHFIDNHLSQKGNAFWSKTHCSKAIFVHSSFVLARLVLDLYNCFISRNADSFWSHHSLVSPTKQYSHLHG